MANQNMMQVSLGSKQNPMNLILSGHDKGIQVSFKTKGNKKNKITCPGHKEVWIPPPAKSTRRIRHCCLYPNNELMLTLPEDGKFLLPNGFPLIIESNHLENFKAAIYPPYIPDSIPSPIKSTSIVPSDDYSKHFKDSYNKQLEAVKASEMLLKEHGGWKGVLSKQINALKRNLDDISKCINDIEIQESGVKDKRKNKVLFQSLTSDKHSQKLSKPKFKSYVQPTETKIPPGAMQNRHIKWTEDSEQSVQPCGKVPAESVMIKLADNMRKSKLLIDSALEQKKKVNDLERKYIEEVEALYEDQQRLLRDVFQALECPGFTSSEDGPDDGPDYNQPRDPTVEPDGNNEFDPFEVANREKFKLNSMPNITNFLRNQSLAEQLAKANFELEKLRKEMQLMKTNEFKEPKQTHGSLRDDRNVQQIQETVQGTTEIPLGVDTEMGPDSSLREVIGAINHKYRTLRHKGCENNVYETTLTQKMKSDPITSTEKTKSVPFLDKESLAHFSNAQNAMKKLEEKIKKMLPILPHITNQPGAGPETPIVITHREENVSANILRESENGREVTYWHDNDDDDCRGRKIVTGQFVKEKRDTGMQTPEIQPTDTSTVQETRYVNEMNAQYAPTNGVNAQEVRRVSEANVQPNATHEANLQQTRHVNKMQAQYGTKNGVNAQEVRHVSEANVQPNATREANVQQTRHINEMNIRQNTMNGAKRQGISDANAYQNAADFPVSSIKPKDNKHENGDRFQKEHKLQKQKRRAYSLGSKVPTPTDTAHKHYLTYDELLKLTGKGSLGFEFHGTDTVPSAPPLENQYTPANMNAVQEQRQRSLRDDAETIPKTRLPDEIQEDQQQAFIVPSPHAQGSLERRRIPQDSNSFDADFQGVLESTRVVPRGPSSGTGSSDSFNRARMLSGVSLHSERSGPSATDRRRLQKDPPVQKDNINSQELLENRQDPGQHNVPILLNYELDQDNRDKLQQAVRPDLPNYGLELEKEAGPSDSTERSQTWYDLSEGSISDDTEEEQEIDQPNYELVQQNAAGPANSSEHSQKWYNLSVYEGSTLVDPEEEHEIDQPELPAHGGRRNRNGNSPGKYNTDRESSKQWYRPDTYSGEMNAEGNRKGSANLLYKQPRTSLESQAVKLPKHSQEKFHENNQKPVPSDYYPRFNTHENNQKPGPSGNYPRFNKHENIMNTKQLDPKMNFNTMPSADTRPQNIINDTGYENVAEPANYNQWKYKMDRFLLDSKRYQTPQMHNSDPVSPRLRLATLPDVKVTMRTQSPTNNNNFSPRRHTTASAGNDNQRMKIRKLYEDIMS